MLKSRVQQVRSLIPATVRYGPLYRRQLAFLMDSQWQDPAALEACQVQQLRSLLADAFRNVPHYRELSRQLSLRAEDFRELADLRQLPILTREDVRTRQEELLSEKVPPSARLRRYTGGTSGSPLGFVAEGGRTDPLERAFVARIWSWFGVRFEDPAVLLRGYALSPRVLKSGTYWQRWYPERNWFGFSSFLMTRENLPKYAAKIREINPVLISCVASDLDLLAQFWLARRLPPLPRLKAIHQSGMLMYPDQRERFEAAFGARAFSTYGQSECTVLASECECSTRYHVFPEYGITEILRHDGQPTARGEVGEVVATGFNNHALPFIRYRTGDLAAWSARPCQCGRKFPILESMEGRGQYMVVSEDGLVVSLNSILYGSHLPELKAIKRLQVHQEEPGRLRILVVPTGEFTSEVEADFVRALWNVVDGRMNFQVQRVNEIPYRAGEKFKVLVQSLDVDWWAGYRRAATGPPDGSGS